MNESEEIYEVDEYSIVAALTVALGLATFVSNFLLLCIIIRLLNRSDKYGIIIHTFFVCLNDTLCGLLLFLAGVWRVQDLATAYTCAYLILSSFALQIVSQANITCVCVQRYVFARHIRKTYTKWKSVHMKTLVFVNALIGGGSLVFYFSKAHIDNVPKASIRCKLAAVMSTDMSVLLVNFILGLVFTITANIFCLLTISTLKTELHGTTQSITIARNNKVSVSSSQLDESVQQSMRICQQRATVTMLLIVLFFNISFLPTVIGNIVGLSGVHIPYVLRRPVLLALFVNSIVNPIIIVTRIKDIRSSIKDVYVNVKARL